MLTAYIDPSLITTDIPFPTTNNTDEKFYVLPQDPCHATVLSPQPVANKTYFIGDVTLRILGATTKDSISINSLNLYLVDGSTFDKCGYRTYQLFTTANAAPTFATIPMQQEPPIVSVYTKNVANVGEQTLMLMTGLANYPYINASYTFTVMIYNLKIGKEIAL
jgi:hypothetical protein